MLILVDQVWGWDLELHISSEADAAGPHCDSWSSKDVEVKQSQAGC